MNITNITPTFQAQWTPANRDLKPPAQNLIRTISKIAWNVISALVPIILVIRMIGWGVAALAKKATLPAAHYYPPEKLQEIRDVFDTHCHGAVTEQNRALREAYEVERHNVITPDGIALSTIHFKHKNSGPDTPTVIYYGPNMSVSELFIHSWLLQKTIEQEEAVNFVVYDPRSVSLSRGNLTNPKQLILDGDSIYQFVTEKLGAKNPRLYGWSLGGSISANVKARHPECTAPYVNERSFSSTRAVVESHLTGWKKLFLFWFPFAMSCTKWNLKAPIEKVSGDFMIVHHPQDSTIPYSASCHRAAIQAQKHFTSLKLRNTDFLSMAEIAGYGVYHHAHPLTDYEVEGRYNRQRADRVITDFLFRPASPAQMERTA